MCKECFYKLFEEEIHNTIVNNKLFTKGDTVAIGASGGKGFFNLFDILFILFIFSLLEKPFLL